MSQQASYRGPERRRFRRLDLEYAVRLETTAKSPGGARTLVEGVTENISFGGALVGVVDASALPGATPVTVRFLDEEAAVPSTVAGVIWRHLEGHDERVAIEFDAPLLAYEGAVEVADRVEWLREMGGDEFARQNVARFLDAVSDAIRLAHERISAGDLQAVAQLTRDLKSHAGNIGAVNLYEMARRAEQAARAGDAASARRFVDALPTYFEAIRDELEP
jgi:HPt (histidine-containing phosphotransfer) domain-containing protein